MIRVGDTVEVINPASEDERYVVGDVGVVRLIDINEDLEVMFDFHEPGAAAVVYQSEVRKVEGL